MIINCTCKHEFQDKEHGKGRRVANKTSGSKDSTKAKCTVCGKVTNK